MTLGRLFESQMTGGKGSPLRCALGKDAGFLLVWQAHLAGEVRGAIGRVWRKSAALQAERADMQFFRRAAFEKSTVTVGVCNFDIR